MLLSARRAVIATCTVATFVLLFAFNRLRLANPTVTSVSPSAEAFGGLVPHWTTEQENPRFAYVQYATDLDYLCNAMINFARLDRFATHFNQVLIHPEAWNEPGSSPEQTFLRNIQKHHPRVHLHPVPTLSTSTGDPTWSKSLTKFHAFALTAYTRVLVFDSDALVLNNMDHTFLSPLAPVAVPRAYWLTDPKSSIKDQMLASHVMLIEPNTGTFNRIMVQAKESGAFDMEVLNALFADSAMVLPHRRYALLTGEFRKKDHGLYLAEDPDVEWNAMAEVSRAYLVHFSDWPLPKPWVAHSEEQWEQALPGCADDDVSTADRPRCADRFMWTGFYEDYDRDREAVCGPLMG
ncbi:Glycosyltransferase family 8 protein [Aspergillus mulundensis]|uniref:Glycosyltransferase family 8 protein n=1 Tax=Aspergillus mulundensis TaxID=1810919 RepID=A0A3D8RE92_9EURO|nr:Glycosyltransferase family 8 protein [Aspergillus mulundensis]RDW72359.1 Glycosyltransferase family 8 protein [Aspergillus mulundensis]